MPSGMSLVAKHGCWGRGDCYLNIQLHPLAEDFANSEGLCGNYNDEKGDDRTVKGSNIVETFDETVEFAKSYM